MRGSIFQTHVGCLHKKPTEQVITVELCKHSCADVEWLMLCSTLIRWITSCEVISTRQAEELIKCLLAPFVFLLLEVIMVVNLWSSKSAADVLDLLHNHLVSLTVRAITILCTWLTPLLSYSQESSWWSACNRGISAAAMSLTFPHVPVSLAARDIMILSPISC